MRRLDRLRAIYRPRDPSFAGWPERDWIGREAVWEVLWLLRNGEWLCQIEPKPPAPHPMVFAPSGDLEIIEQLVP